jgi:ketosteroid isomerase-like protein
MRNVRLAVLAGLAIVACAPPAPPPPDVAAIKTAIESENAKFSTLLLKGDTVGMAGNYQDDAILMMPNTPASTGRAAYMTGAAQFFAGGAITAAAFKTHDVIAAGEYAIETGSYEWTFQPKKGKAMPDKGKYLTVWHKQTDGSWKIVRDINNSDLPAGK